MKTPGIYTDGLSMDKKETLYQQNCTEFLKIE